jgi:hypothetical protein
MFHYVTNFSDFIQTLPSLAIGLKDEMVSFYGASLFSHIPFKEITDLLDQLFNENITSLFYQALTSTYFLFDCQCYEQKDGATMGITNWFMAHLEAWELNTATLKTLDNKFLIRPHVPHEFDNVLCYIRANRNHPNTQSTTKRKKRGHLLFLGKKHSYKWQKIFMIHNL